MLRLPPGLPSHDGPLHHAGVDAKGRPGCWDDSVAAMAVQFQEGRLREGLVEGLNLLGGQLTTYFPYREDDTDELSDEVRFG